MERVPSMFVLLGSFQSFSCNATSTDYTSIKDNFAALAELLAGFPRIKVCCSSYDRYLDTLAGAPSRICGWLLTNVLARTKTHVWGIARWESKRERCEELTWKYTQAESRLVFVPGLGDAGPGAILPRPPLPDSLTAPLRDCLPNAIFASNPCRIRHYNQASASQNISIKSVGTSQLTARCTTTFTNLRGGTLRARPTVATSDPALSQPLQIAASHALLAAIPVLFQQWSLSRQS